MNDTEPKKQITLEDLMTLMATLRSEQGCPWDRKQTKGSIKPYIIEEAYEVVEAVEEHNPTKICEELGDLLFQIIFYAQLLSEEDSINMYTIMQTVYTKMIRRHPHVFGDLRVNDAEEVLVNWEQIKQQEKQAERSSILEGVPKELPSLLKAHRIQSKVVRVGFEWENFDQILEKFDEEFYELRQAYKRGNREDIEDEFGDLLFVLVSIARFLKINPDDALRKAITKFTTRFTRMEHLMHTLGKGWQDLSGAEMDQLWSDAKETM